MMSGIGYQTVKDIFLDRIEIEDNSNEILTSKAFSVSNAPEALAVPVEIQ